MKKGTYKPRMAPEAGRSPVLNRGARDMPGDLIYRIASPMDKVNDSGRYDSPITRRKEEMPFFTHDHVWGYIGSDVPLRRFRAVFQGVYCRETALKRGGVNPLRYAYSRDYESIWTTGSNGKPQITHIDDEFMVFDGEVLR